MRLIKIFCAAILCFFSLNSLVLGSPGSIEDNLESPDFRQEPFSYFDFGPRGNLAVDEVLHQAYEERRMAGLSKSEAENQLRSAVTQAGCNIEIVQSSTFEGNLFALSRLENIEARRNYQRLAGLIQTPFDSQSLNNLSLFGAQDLRERYRYATTTTKCANANKLLEAIKTGEIDEANFLSNDDYKALFKIAPEETTWGPGTIIAPIIISEAARRAEQIAAERAERYNADRQAEAVNASNTIRVKDELDSLRIRREEKVRENIRLSAVKFGLIEDESISLDEVPGREQELNKEIRVINNQIENREEYLEKFDVLDDPPNIEGEFCQLSSDCRTVLNVYWEAFVNQVVRAVFNCKGYRAEEIDGLVGRAGSGTNLMGLVEAASKVTPVTAPGSGGTPTDEIELAGNCSIRTILEELGPAPNCAFDCEERKKERRAITEALDTGMLEVQVAQIDCSTITGPRSFPITGGKVATIDSPDSCLQLKEQFFGRQAVLEDSAGQGKLESCVEEKATNELLDFATQSFTEEPRAEVDVIEEPETTSPVDRVRQQEKAQLRTQIREQISALGSLPGFSSERLMSGLPVSDKKSIYLSCYYGTEYNPEAIDVDMGN